MMSTQNAREWRAPRLHMQADGTRTSTRHRLRLHTRAPDRADLQFLNRRGVADGDNSLRGCGSGGSDGSALVMGHMQVRHAPC